MGTPRHSRRSRAPRARSPAQPAPTCNIVLTIRFEPSPGVAHELGRATSPAARNLAGSVDGFLAECTQAASSLHSVSGGELRAAYIAWCASVDGRPLKAKAFGEALTARGCKRKHSNGTRYIEISLTTRGEQLLAETRSRSGRRGARRELAYKKPKLRARVALALPVVTRS